MTIKPISATIFSYQVGFGDCFLLRFNYPKTQRHVLVDFGTTGLPENVATNHLLNIAQDIREKCGGQLDAVVATHRHADHISGFATNPAGNGPGDVIRALSPKVVVQPWTEDPKLATDARAPTPRPGSGRAAVASLANMHATCEQVVTMLDKNEKTFSTRLSRELRFIGEDNLSNKSAVRNLATMAPSRCYVYHGSKSGLELVLPGVKTHVLGPPTIKQSEAITKQRSKDIDEYWHLQLKRVTDDLLTASNANAVFPHDVSAKGGKLPMSVRWIANRMKEARGEQMLQIVRSLDRQMNNTSIILLFETATRKLLFPGDAQIENWQFALKHAKYEKLLADVDLYKVGHHGSLNATPRTMWEKFTKKGPKNTKGRMTTLLSTRSGKHGHEKTSTEVPRATLLNELKSQTHLHNTEALESGVLYEEIHVGF